MTKIRYIILESKWTPIITGLIVGIALCFIVGCSQPSKYEKWPIKPGPNEYAMVTE